MVKTYGIYTNLYYLIGRGGVNVNHCETESRIIHFCLRRDCLSTYLANPVLDILDTFSPDIWRDYQKCL